ncbi:site-2 protease family protein [Sphaerimonospora cavernae]|uniref:Site-2 protease family protein n=1 Tax=Sphaerimonospora cavernae TaxID=1740611 RepID=A0ABV6UAI8_9ACTN
MTTAVTMPAAYRPALREGVLVSEALLRDATIVHLIKDTGSGASFRIGVREHFLISRMDGERSLAEISDEYALASGHPLAETAWQQILALLGSRGLLAGTPAASATASSSTAASSTAGASPQPARSPLRGSIRLVADADATIARLHRAIGFLLAPAWLAPLLIMIAIMEVALVLHAGELVDATWELFHQPVLLTGVACLLWLSTALHELAHGVAARHHGGHVAEIGLRWRLPLVIMYCTVDDYMYLGTRRQRIAIAAAGAMMNLLFLLPFFAVWVFAPVDAATREALSGLLFLGSVHALTMLIPLPPLDGYKIAGQLLSATELAASTGAYLKLRARRDAAATRYPRQAKIAYTVYGWSALLVLSALAAALSAIVHRLLTAA